MNKDDILSWKDKYDKEEDLYNKGDEDELRVKFQTNGYITKEDLIRIVKWKFQGNLLGRQKRILNLMSDVDSIFIQEVSRLAFKCVDDENKLNLFSCIRGIGNALSSVILAFYDPKNYGVLDIHAWRGLFGKEPSDVFSNNKHAIKFFKELRGISSETGLYCRDIEKAIFKQDLDDGNN